MLTEFFRDFRFGARLLRRSPGFTFTALVSLALGIGGTTAVFSLVNAIVLRSLPVPNPQQLRQIEIQAPGQDYGQILSGPTFIQLRDAVAARHGAELFAATSPTGMQIQPGDGQSEPISVDYRVRKADSGFKIFDVIIEGVSMISTQRSEFASVIGNNSIDYLIDQLSAKAKAGDIKDTSLGK